VVAFLEPKTPLVGEAVRGAGVEITRQFASHVIGSAIVLEGSGFWAARFINVLTKILLVTEVKIPQRVFSGMHEAAPWLATEAGGSETELLRAVAIVRGRMHEHTEFRRAG